MNAAARLVAFFAVLALLGAGGALAGATLGPDRTGDEPAAPEHGHAAEPAEAGAAGHGEHETAAPADAVRGLAVADDGLRLELLTPELPRGERADLRFRIASEDDGATVRDFDVEHARRMHVIVVRRDLSGFQHVHPRQAADGSWSVPVRLDDPGSYRVFADFAHEGTTTTLAADLRVDGPADLRDLPAPAPIARDGAYEVRLDGAEHLHAGEAAALDFTVTRDGQPVQVQPYLAAAGHLVALREGDLAFLHVHPESDDAPRFAATFPTAGRYRLFLQVRHDDLVRTFPFTVEVGR